MILAKGVLPIELDRNANDYEFCRFVLMICNNSHREYNLLSSSRIRINANMKEQLRVFEYIRDNYESTSQC